MKRLLAILLLILLAPLARAQSGGEPRARTTVGIEGRVLLRYPGSIRPTNPEEKSAIVVRIAEQADDNGQTLYDLRFIADYPGEFDLRAFIERTDGASLADTPPMWVEVGSLLPETHQGELFEIAGITIPRLGGYRLALAALGVLWLFPLFYIIGRRLARRRPPPPPAPDRPITLADQLRPLVEAAIRRDLSTGDRARLEMLLLAYWRDRLKLRSQSHIDALMSLRAHPEAGVLLVRIESWFHHPPSTAGEPPDLTTLLQPYRAAAPLTV